jgi:Tol biopolymer transport system component
MSLKRATGFLAAAMLVVAAPAAAAQGNGRLAYEAAGSIYMISPDGGAPSLLHTGLLPAFSPDGTRIVFAQTPSDPLGPLTIWVADADGTNARQIGTSPGPRKFSWSPDGTRIAFVSDDGSGFSVVVLKADGGGSTTVSYDASASGPPSWSPDGTELAFTTTNDADIAVAKADGSGRRLLIQDSTRDVAPSWSPHGSQIAFLREANGAFRLYSIQADGTHLHQLGQTTVFVPAPPAWSPDGSRLLFGGSETVGYTRYGPYYRSDVYTVAADGAGERRLTDSSSPSAGFGPSWSPDGRRIAFLSSRERSTPFANLQLYVMNADGTCETQRTSSSPVSTPSWQALPAGSAAADPLRCAALSITGSVDVERDHPALDDSRVYIYRGVVANNGNVSSDPLHVVTTDESPLSYVSASASNGACTIGARASCTLPALPPGGTAEIELRFNVFVSGTFEIEPAVEATGQTPDGDSSDNTDDLYRHFPFCAISTRLGSTLRAGGDDDLICGTVGRDTIFAADGRDRVYGGMAHDVVHGGGGTDEIDGGGNTDLIYGDGGADKLYGDIGDDVLIGGAGNDILWGGGGGDNLRGGPGADRFLAGYGNDLIDSRDGLTEHVYCGDGNDSVEADLRDIVHACEKVIRRPAAQIPAPR